MPRPSLRTMTIPDSTITWETRGADTPLVDEIPRIWLEADDVLTEGIKANIAYICEVYSLSSSSVNETRRVYYRNGKIFEEEYD